MARPRTVDPDQVKAMAGWGAPKDIVCDRLDCSRRHLRRIIRNHGIDWPDDPGWYWGTRWERLILWRYLHRLYDFGPSDIAYRVGRSAQAVSQFLTKQKSADPDAWNGTAQQTPDHRGS